MGFIKRCSACGCLENSPEHWASRVQCSKIKKAQYDEYIKTPAYQNEQAALLEAKKKAKKASEVPFALILDKRGVPSRINFL